MASLLSLHKIVVNGTESLSLVSVLPLSVGLEFSQPLDLLLFLGLFFLELLDFIGQVVDFLFHLISLIGLVSHISLSLGDLHLLSIDVLPVSGNLLLQVGVGSVLLVEQESKVIKFFLETHDSHLVAVVFCFEVVVL